MVSTVSSEFASLICMLSPCWRGSSAGTPPTVQRRAFSGVRLTHRCESVYVSPTAGWRAVPASHTLCDSNPDKEQQSDVCKGASASTCPAGGDCSVNFMVSPSLRSERQTEGQPSVDLTLGEVHLAGNTQTCPNAQISSTVEPAGRMGFVVPAAL